MVSKPKIILMDGGMDITEFKIKALVYAIKMNIKSVTIQFIGKIKKMYISKKKY